MVTSSYGRHLLHWMRDLKVFHVQRACRKTRSQYELIKVKFLVRVTPVSRRANSLTQANKFIPFPADAIKQRESIDKRDLREPEVLGTPPRRHSIVSVSSAAPAAALSSGRHGARRVRSDHLKVPTRKTPAVTIFRPYIVHLCSDVGRRMIRSFAFHRARPIGRRRRSHKAKWPAIGVDTGDRGAVSGRSSASG